MRTLQAAFSLRFGSRRAAATFLYLENGAAKAAQPAKAGYYEQDTFPPRLGGPTFTSSAVSVSPKCRLVQAQEASGAFRLSRLHGAHRSAAQSRIQAPSPSWNPRRDHSTRKYSSSCLPLCKRELRGL